MNLWNIIRDFFVKYVFGGTYIVDGTEFFYDTNLIGYAYNSGSGNGNRVDTSTFYVPINGYEDIGANVIDYLSIGDWLSTTATIITLVALFIGISCLLVSLFRWIVRLVSLRG